MEGRLWLMGMRLRNRVGGRCGVIDYDDWRRKVSQGLGYGIVSLCDDWLIR